MARLEWNLLDLILCKVAQKIIQGHKNIQFQGDRTGSNLAEARAIENGDMEMTTSRKGTFLTVKG